MLWKAQFRVSSVFSLTHSMVPYRSGRCSGTEISVDTLWMTDTSLAIPLACRTCLDRATIAEFNSHAYTLLAPDLTAIILCRKQGEKLIFESLELFNKQHNHVFMHTYSIIINIHVIMYCGMALNFTWLLNYSLVK